MNRYGSLPRLVPGSQRRIDGVDLVDDQDAATEAAWRGGEIAMADAVNGNPPRSLLTVVAAEQSSPRI